MGKFPSYPGTIDVKSVVHCSSEDSDYPGSNIVNKPGRAWRCSRKEAGTGRASITLELDSPTYIQSIDIVNAGSAFIQVDGLTREETSPVPLLPMRMIMSEQDCKSSSVSVDYTSTHVFKRSDFAEDSFRRFKLLVVTVMQPFKLGYPFGIGKMVVTKPCYADKIQKQTPGLSDPNKGEEIEFSFMKRSPKKQPLNERIWSLNDAVNDENFEMRKSAPMNRLGTKTKEKLNVPKRNSYFANLNEQHGFVYKTPRSKKKSNSGKTPLTAEKTESEATKDEDKENASVDNSKSFYGDKEVTPSRKRKKSKLNIVDSADPKNEKKRNLNKKADDDEDDLPEFSLTKVSDEETDPSSSRTSASSKSPSWISASSKSPSRTSALSKSLSRTSALSKSLSRTSALSKSPSRSPTSSKSPSRTSAFSKSPSRSPAFLSVTPGRCSFTKSPDLSKRESDITEVSPGSGGKKIMRTPKRMNTQPSWISSSFGNTSSRKSPKDSSKSDTTTGKNRKTSGSRSGKTPTNKSPARSRNDNESETPSTRRWNSTVNGHSPKFITIADIDDDRKSPKRNRKSSDNTGVIIIDERSPGTTTPGRSNKCSKDKTIRISVTNSRPGASRRADDDDVLVCNPLPSSAKKAARARENFDGFGEVSEVELVACPMCGDSFLPNVIETHANNCIDSFNKFD